MKPVDTGSFLTLHYRLAGPDGADVINTFGAQPATLSLGAGQLAPAMEALLIGLRRGRARDASSSTPGEAFGERKPELLQRVARSLLHATRRRRRRRYEVGDVVQFPTPDGEPALRRRGARGRPTTGCCSTSTTRWPASRVTFEVQLIGVL